MLEEDEFRKNRQAFDEKKKIIMEDLQSQQAKNL